MCNIEVARARTGKRVKLGPVAPVEDVVLDDTEVYSIAGMTIATASTRDA